MSGNTDEKTRTEILISGFGGQGVIRMGQILGLCAIKQGHRVTMLKSHGLVTARKVRARHKSTGSLLRTAVEPNDIWCIDYKKAHKLLPKNLQSTLNSSISDVFTVDMLAQVAVDLDALNGYGDDSERSRQFVLFFEPPSLDERVINQFSLHSMMSSPTTILDDWLEEHAELCYKIVLPAKIKWEIRDKLDQANINERILYPGLDGLCRWLRRYYGPRTIPFS